MEQQGNERWVDDRERRRETLEAQLSRLQNVLLVNRARGRIVEELLQRPGPNKRQLSERLSLPSTTVGFHLGRLEEHGIVRTRGSAQDRETLCFLALDQHLWSRDEYMILFGRRAKRNIALYVLANPGTGSGPISDAVRRERGTVRHHLRTLRTHDMVRHLQLGRRFHYHPSELLEEWGRDVDGLFPPVPTSPP